MLLLAAALAVGGWRSSRALAPLSSGSRRTVRVVIHPGTRTSGIARQLQSAGVIRSWIAFDALAYWRHDASRLQAGEYDFSPAMTLQTVLNRIVRGDVVVYHVTVPDGVGVERVAEAVARSGLASSADVVAAARDASLVSAWLPAGAPVRYPVEGYLFPDTYTFTRADNAHTILATMVARFRQAIAPLQAAAAAQHLSVNQWTTLASIVEREASRPGDQAGVAAVYRNRLRRKMDLQSDPTVLYALNRTSGSLSAADLKVDSPYNTYAHVGLPPGPIASPSLSALKAVLHPAKTSALFFLAKPDGTLVFANTYAQQLANERAYLKNNH